MLMKFRVFLALALLMIGCKKVPDTMDLPEACFTWLPDSKNYVGDTVYFQNCSKHADSYQWAFGDDSTSSLAEPWHVFTEEGNYQVSLIASGNERSDTIYTSIDITVRPGPTYRRIIHNKEVKSIGRGGVFSTDLDVDGDGTPDYLILIDSWFAMASSWSRGHIEGIHGTFSVNAYTIADTTFLNNTWSVMDGEYWGKEVAVIRTVTESCYRIAENDSIIKINTIERVTRFRQEELVNPADLWTTNRLHFWSSRSYVSFLNLERSNADTVWFRTTPNIEDSCHDFPKDTAYIGIRYLYGDLIKTGWIRVLVEYGKIQIFDSGIME